MQNIKCFLLDMDGTFFISDHLLPGAVQFLNLLKEKKIPFYFLTNNSSKDKSFYFRKLNRLGLKVDSERIFTSGEATAIYLIQHYCNARVYAVATPELEHELEKGGVKLTKVNPDIVVLGYDTSLTYDKLAKFCEFVSSGIKYIVTHPDVNFPVDDGFIPDIGAIMAFIKATTNRRPDIIIGKPYMPILSALEVKSGFDIKDMAMVGDRLYTEWR